jgi:hypothetical protein
MFITNLVKGQSQIEIELTIDTDCNCYDSLIIEPGSKFGIYAYTPVPKYSGNYVDTLIKELKIRKKQTISLEQGTYKLIYTPSDSSKQNNQYYFALNPYETQVHLNCFFFNKNYRSVLDAMNKKDTVVINSTYFGNTNGQSIIPTHTVVIFKKHKKYYASYYKTEQRELIIEYTNPKFETQIVLSEEQLQQFRKFEENFLEISINDNLNFEVNSKNHIWIHDKIISFGSKDYVALLLWNELNKTTANN